MVACGARAPGHPYDVTTLNVHSVIEPVYKVV